MTEMEEITNAAPARERNMGIELFRAVSMLLVVCVHVLGQGGICAGAEKLSLNYTVVWYLETLAYCSVDCFALISGFVGVGSSWKPRRIVTLWLEVAAITVSSTLIVSLFVPGGTVSADEWLNAFFPLTRKELWYFNAYFILFFFLPVFNKGITALSKRQHLMAVLVLLGATTVLTRVADRDIFCVNYGFSCLWLMILYLLGAYFKLYGFPRFAKPYVTLPLFFLSGAAALWEKLDAETRVARGLLDPGSARAENAGFLISYISPFMVLMAVCLLSLFARVKIRTRGGKFIVGWLGRSAFGVFVLHVGSACWNHFLPFRYTDIASLPPLAMVGRIGLTVVLFYLGCSLYSIVWQVLFRAGGRLAGKLRKRA